MSPSNRRTPRQRGETVTPARQRATRLPTLSGSGIEQSSPLEDSSVTLLPLSPRKRRLSDTLLDRSPAGLAASAAIGEDDNHYIEEVRQRLLDNPIPRVLPDSRMVPGNPFNLSTSVYAP